MSLLEHGSIVDLAVAVKMSKLEATIRKKWKMGLSGVFMSLSLSLLQNNGQSWFQEFVGLVERESLFLLRRERKSEGK